MVAARMRSGRDPLTKDNVVRTAPTIPRVAWRMAALLVLALATRAASFVNFESGHVRPLVLDPSGRLLAVNTPDNRITIFEPTPDGLRLAGEVPVGLEPVAIAVRVAATGAVEAWVVNHLSDSVSVVEIDASNAARARLVRTIQVGDEPRDIVIAGTTTERVFITTAHRGQRRPADARLTTPGVGRADVWVFDAETAVRTADPAPLAVVELFGDTPRALARSPDGALVYAAVFHSGNRTTTVTERVVSANGGLPPLPRDSPYRRRGFPSTGLIVRFDPPTGRWLDEIGRDWSVAVPFSLPDYDVFAIDAAADPPRPASELPPVSGVGTVLFNIAVRPDTGAVYVSNTEARNHVRFEPTLRGHATENRISVIRGGIARPVHLNPHIDYAVVPGPSAEVERSLALPTGMAFSRDGRRLYVAASGSAKVAVLDADALEAGEVVGEHVAVGAGPSGVVLDEERDRLYVMNRIDHTISVVSLASLVQTATVPAGYDPSPLAVRAGRRFLYDARNTSAHGDQACASCHVFGDFDSLAWDLGDPYGKRRPNRNRFESRSRIGFPPGRRTPFHPMKGPMSTQSLRGLAGAGPMHWRGDRTVVRKASDGTFDESGAFARFNGTFVSLLGRSRKLSRAEMRAFTDFVLTIRYPPNPIQAGSGLPTERERAGRDFFGAAASTRAAATCSTCHGASSAAPDDFLGTNGRSVTPPLLAPQQFKTPHLRNLYQKVGMFAVVGAQVRGFGFLHDGSMATIPDFLRAGRFSVPDDAGVRAVEAFLFAFDTGLSPVIGRQVHHAPEPNDPAFPSLFLGDIGRPGGGYDIAMKTVVAGEPRGFVFTGSALDFQSDRRGEPPISLSALHELARASREPQVYTLAPPGSGVRIGVDRDEDGAFDGDERDAGTDPADPSSHP